VGLGSLIDTLTFRLLVIAVQIYDGGINYKPGHGIKSSRLSTADHSAIYAKQVQGWIAGCLYTLVFQRRKRFVVKDTISRVARFGGGLPKSAHGRHYRQVCQIPSPSSSFNAANLEGPQHYHRRCCMHLHLTTDEAKITGTCPDISVP